MKKIIIIVFIVFLAGTAYADSAWDRVVQESESCAMVAYDISPTPISREVHSATIAKDVSRNFTKEAINAKISQCVLAAKSRVIYSMAEGAGDSDIIAVMTQPVFPGMPTGKAYVGNDSVPIVGEGPVP